MTEEYKGYRFVFRREFGITIGEAFDITGNNRPKIVGKKAKNGHPDSPEIRYMIRQSLRAKIDNQIRWEEETARLSKIWEQSEAIDRRETANSDRIPCSSCGQLRQADNMATCPACQRLTCVSCQCRNDAGRFVICQSCADLAASMGNG
ncbi:MAG: hypothetical protein KDI62_24020 [Anaerolineae bacterium]|nr:hypothetical protein [Anaerolineales bacterium]MCB0181315.1 hypothetical protein [Anaerolineae bacterium]